MHHNPKTNYTMERRMLLLSIGQLFLAILSIRFAFVEKSMDTVNADLHTRSANGLYYGSSILFLMDSLLSLLAGIFGIHSAKNWNLRAQYYHSVCTMYTFCSTIMLLFVTIYLLQHTTSASSVHDEKTKNTIVLLFVLFAAVYRMFTLRTSQKWKKMLQERNTFASTSFPSPMCLTMEEDPKLHYTPHSVTSSSATIPYSTVV